MDDHFVSSSPRLTCFSQNHGRNVILLEDHTVAYRKASFANAVTVSEKPVLPGEIFLVEIEQTEPGWTGHMRLGLTQRHPTSPLPLYSIPDLSNGGDSWICAITKYHNNVRVGQRTASTRVHRPYPGREDGAAPPASTGEHQPYEGREDGAAPHASAGEHQPYEGREDGAAPHASAEDRSYCGCKDGTASTAFMGKDRPLNDRVTGATPTACTWEDRPYGGIEAGADDVTDVTGYQDDPVPIMLHEYSVNGLCFNQMSQNSSIDAASKNYFTNSEPFLYEAPGGSDYDAVIHSLCENTSKKMNKGSSPSPAQSYGRKGVRQSKSVNDPPSHGTEVSLSPDVVAGMSAYLPSDLVRELANCGISSSTLLVDSAAKTNCFDMACDIFISSETSGTAMENFAENKLSNSTRTRSNFPIISFAGQNNSATFLHNKPISFTSHGHDCDYDPIQDTATDLVQASATDRMLDIATDLMHDTNRTNGLPNISNDNPCSSRLESSIAEDVSQSLGASTSASFDTVNVIPSTLTENNVMFSDISNNNSVDKVEECNSPDEGYTPSLAAMHPREVVEEVYEGHVEEEDGGADEEGEYESCLTRLSLGDNLSTSRGLVPRSLLLPSARYQSATLLATDEGSRIGLLYLPRVGGYAEMHYIINGEDQGVFTRLLPYKKAPLHAVVDVYGTTKRVRIVQLYGVVSLKSACRATILQRLSPNTISMLPLPPQLQKYLLEEGPYYC